MTAKPAASAPPTLPLDGRTLIFDTISSEQVLWIEGVVPLPVGATIQLGPPNVDVKVVRVRLLAGRNTRSALVCLDVAVPAAYWGEGEGAIETEPAR